MSSGNRLDLATLIDTRDSLRRHGLIVERRPDGSIAANADLVPLHGTAFECGYGGSGPADLALAVMHALLPPLLSPDDQAVAFGTDELEPRADLDELLDEDQNWSTPVGRDRVHVSNLAQKLHQAFKWDHIATMNRDGGFVPIEVIDAWIERKRTELKEHRCRNTTAG